MEINSSYSAKSIPKVDNTAYGKDAKVDNFADLLSTATDKNSNKNNLQNTTSAKKSASNSDNSATKDVQNTKDIPLVIGRNDIDQHEEVEENLNIIEKEKELIIKALKKHRSKRKDAALDLGISERTLYRKLKEYDIENL